MSVSRFRKPDPEVGMRVTWANEVDVYDNGKFYLRLTLIPEYGTDPMIVESVENMNEWGWRVTLSRDGIMLRVAWVSPDPQPVDWLGEILFLNWNYLRPI